MKRIFCIIVLGIIGSSNLFAAARLNMGGDFYYVRDDGIILSFDQSGNPIQAGQIWSNRIQALRMNSV